MKVLKVLVVKTSETLVGVNWNYFFLVVHNFYETVYTVYTKTIILDQINHGKYW